MAIWLFSLTNFISSVVNLDSLCTAKTPKDVSGLCRNSWYISFELKFYGVVCAVYSLLGVKKDANIVLEGDLWWCSVTLQILIELFNKKMFFSC